MPKWKKINCLHNKGAYITSGIMDNVARTILMCKLCKEVIDYIPKRDGDSKKFSKIFTTKQRFNKEGLPYYKTEEKVKSLPRKPKYYKPR